jgi:hypothetical protein
MHFTTDDCRRVDVEVEMTAIVGDKIHEVLDKPA